MTTLLRDHSKNASAILLGDDCAMLVIKAGWRNGLPVWVWVATSNSLDVYDIGLHAPWKQGVDIAALEVISLRNFPELIGKVVLEERIVKVWVDINDFVASVVLAIMVLENDPHTNIHDVITGVHALLEYFLDNLLLSLSGRHCELKFESEELED
jgi:hypothetical protein